MGGNCAFKAIAFVGQANAAMGLYMALNIASGTTVSIQKRHKRSFDSIFICKKNQYNFREIYVS